MKTHRFIGDFDLSKKRLSVAPDMAEQMKNVLRLKAGDVVILGDGAGREATAKISSFGNGGAVVDITEVSSPERELDKRIVLFASIIKKENFEVVVQKAVECGVSKIVPVISERTVKLGLNMDRLRKIIREAAEQSGRAVIADICDPVRFSEALDSAEGRVVLFHPGADEFVPGVRHPGTVSVFIGPEGGFSDGEIDEAKGREADILSLGDLTLRAETAAIITSYIARYA
jgi:16S rRNA (uracil1498-N3)-methyltransferase